MKASSALLRLDRAAWLRAAGRGAFVFSILAAAAFRSGIEVGAQPAAAEFTGDSVRLRGSLVNGTSGAPVVVEELSVLDPSQGMRIIASQDNAGPGFAFEDLPVPRGPYLLRAVFQGEAYTRMLPPTPESFATPVRLEVFESGAPAEAVFVTPAMRVLKTNRGLRVDLIHAIENRARPPRSYDARNYQIFVPAGAREIQAGLQHEASPMPAPLTLQGQAGGFQALGRMFRPGSSQLIVSYLLEETELEDRLPRDPGRAADPHGFRVVFYQPADARPEIDGAERVTSEQAPGLGEALRVFYRPGESVRYRFERGGSVFEGPQEATNPIFSDWLRTTLGLIATFFLLLGALSAIAWNVRRSRAGAP